MERDVDAPLDALIDRFAELRADNLAKFDALATDDNLDRTGLHPSLGEVTLRELLATWAVHDLDHVSQIYAGLAGSYDAEVGPWKVYLGILLRRDDPAQFPGEPDSPSSKPKPVPPWKRAEAGVYQSSDERFSIQSEGPSRWFITDEQQQDELGLARTVGPFDTLDAAKAAADALRDEAPAARRWPTARQGREPPAPSKPRKETARGPPAEAATATATDLARQARGRRPRGRASRPTADRRARGRGNRGRRRARAA